MSMQWGEITYKICQFQKYFNARLGKDTSPSYFATTIRIYIVIMCIDLDLIYIINLKQLETHQKTHRLEINFFYFEIPS